MVMVKFLRNQAVFLVLPANFIELVVEKKSLIILGRYERKQIYVGINRGFYGHRKFWN